MFKEILNSPMTPIGIGVKEKAVISNVVTSKGSTPYLVQTPRRYVEELFTVAVRKLRKAGVIDTAAIVKNPRQLSQLLDEDQCEIVWNFIQPAPKGIKVPYAFENADVTLRLKRKGDLDLEESAVEMTAKIAEFFQLPVKEIFIATIDGVDKDNTVAIERKRVTAADVYGDDDIFDESTVFTAEDVAKLTADDLKRLVGVYPAAKVLDTKGKPDAKATRAALIGKPIA